MNLEELRDKLYKFDEGCELTDGVQGLLDSARTLSGIGEEGAADVATILARELVLKYYNWVLSEGETLFMI